MSPFRFEITEKERMKKLIGYAIAVSESLVAAIFYDAGMGRYRDFNGLLNRALDDTSVYFLKEKHIEFRVDELRKILKGQAGKEEVRRLKQGNAFIDDQQLAQEWAKLGSLYFPRPSQILAAATEILAYFRQTVMNYLLEDPKSSSRVVLRYLEIHRESQSRENRLLLEQLQEILSHLKESDRLGQVRNTNTRRQTSVMRSTALPDVLDRQAIDWDPLWKPKHTAGVAILGDEISLSSVEQFARVIVTFQDLPSNDWKDPRLASLAVQDARSNRARPLPAFLWNESGRKNKPRAHKASKGPWARWPLCIPNYDVGVEWRLESYCFSEPWGSAKREVVNSFLKRCQGQNLECSIISLQPNPGEATLLVQSADYDTYLHMEWAYYKGLESALARGQYYKSKTVQAMEGVALTSFAARLAKNPQFRDMIPKRYRDCFPNRKIEGKDVCIMLSGIIERERNAAASLPRSRKDAGRTGPCESMPG
jgi:hypothetical protein